MKIIWSGGDYYMGAMIEKNEEWPNVDHLGESGWEFVSFVPNHEVFINSSFKPKELKFIRLAAFKRQMIEGEDMEWGVTRPM